MRVAVAVDNARLFHAVKEASRQKDEFLAMLAHELRNPLAAIRYAVAIGQMSPSDSPEEMFEIIDRQTQNLAHLIDDLLDVSRISRDKVTLRKEPVDVASIINGAATTVRPLMEEKNHELILEMPTEPICVFADPTRAEQIVDESADECGKVHEKRRAGHGSGDVRRRRGRDRGDRYRNWFAAGIVEPRFRSVCAGRSHVRSFGRRSWELA